MFIVSVQFVMTLLYYMIEEAYQVDCYKTTMMPVCTTVVWMQNKFDVNLERRKMISCVKNFSVLLPT